MGGYSKWATVYRPAFGDCSNGGHSGKETSLPVAGMKLADPEWSDPSIRADGRGVPIYDVEERTIGGKDCPRLVPRIQPTGVCGPMASGNYADVDGRMVPIHDRFETWEQYDANSR